MAKSAIMKRLERLEQSVGHKKVNRVRVYYADGTTLETDVLSLACQVIMHSEVVPVRYEPLGNIRAGNLLKVVDDLMQ